MKNLLSTIVNCGPETSTTVQAHVMKFLLVIGVVLTQSKSTFANETIYFGNQCPTVDWKSDKAMQTLVNTAESPQDKLNIENRIEQVFYSKGYRLDSTASTTTKLYFQVYQRPAYYSDSYFFALPMYIYEVALVERPKSAPSSYEIGPKDDRIPKFHVVDFLYFFTLDDSNPRAGMWRILDSVPNCDNLPNARIDGHVFY